MEKEQAILSIVSRMVTEGQRPWAFLVAVERNGRAHFMDVSRSGYYIPNASVIFVTSHVQTYSHVAEFLKDMGMKQGMTEWLTQQLNNLDESYLAIRHVYEQLQLALKQANQKIANLEMEISALEVANDKLLAELEDADQTRWEKSEY